MTTQEELIGHLEKLIEQLRAQPKRHIITEVNIDSPAVEAPDMSDSDALKRYYQPETYFRITIMNKTEYNKNAFPES